MPGAGWKWTFFARTFPRGSELDGGQHLADAEAYRRDRRKDAMLQKNGYFVLRFLAEDAGKRLDHILDTILATLAHRRPCERASGDGASGGENR